MNEFETELLPNGQKRWVWLYNDGKHDWYADSGQTLYGCFIYTELLEGEEKEWKKLD